jgi:EmrB/QacA subfamily drug resistance transporter
MSGTSTIQAARSGDTHAGAILAFVCLGQFMVFTDASIVNLALPSIERDLHMPPISLNFIVTAYQTLLGGFLILGGRLADGLGRRRMLQIGLVLFALASLASGLAPNGDALITARAFQGLGSALITPAALSILTVTFAEGPARNKALGVWGSLTGIASIVGVIAGGLLAGGPGWRWIFWINVPIGLTAAAFAPRVVPADRDPAAGRRSFDLAGAATLTGGLLVFIFTLGAATRAGWETGRTIGGFAGAAVLLGAFAILELRADSPLIPLRIFRLRTMRTANIAAVLVFGTLSAMFFFASIFMQQAHDYSPTRAGIGYVPLAICVALGAGAASAFIGKISARPILIGGLTLISAGLLLLWRSPADGSYAVDLLIPFLVLGLGCGICYVTLQVAAFVGIPAGDTGVGAGLINTSQETGGALGLAVIATVAYTTGAAGSAGPAALLRRTEAIADHRAFLAAAITSVLALVVVIMLMPRPVTGWRGGPESK